MSGWRASSVWRTHGSVGSRLSIVAVALVSVAVFALLYLGLPVYSIPFLAVLAALSLMILHSPVVGVGLVVAFQYLPLQAGSFTFFQIVGVAVAFFCLVWFSIHKKGLVFPNIVPPLAIMGLLILFSLNYTRNSAGTLMGVRKMTFNLLFCFLLVNVVDSYGKLRWPLWALAGMAMLNSVVGGRQFALRDVPEFRAKGLLENQNVLGELAALGFMVPFCLLLQEKNRWRQLGYMACCGVLLVGIVTSVSRSAVISFFAGLFYIFVRNRRHRKTVIIAAVLVLAAIPFLPKYFLERFSNIGEQVKGTVFVHQRHGLSSRGYFNKAAIRIWKAHPILGVGFGSFGYYYIQPEFNPGLKGSRRLPPHNTYLEVLVELGVVGFVVLCWWILQSAYNYWVAERKAEEDPQKALYLLVCETLTLMVLVSSFSGGTVISTDFVMLTTLSVICRRCSVAGTGSAPVPAH